MIKLPNPYRRKAMLADFVCLGLCATALYLGNDGTMPVWLMILCALAALVALGVAIRYSVLSKRTDRHNVEQYIKQQKDKKQ